MMLNRMRRMFSILYPYHTIAKSEAQKLIDFPLQFYSSEMPSKNSLPHISYSAKYPEVLEGATYSCGLFLSLLAEHNLENLQDIVEWNMLKTLENTFKSYQNLGYTISSIGSRENTKAEILDYNIYNTNLLPYRNLNRKKSEYNISTKKSKEPHPTLHKSKAKFLKIIESYLNFYEFASLNLKGMNAIGNAESFREDLDDIGWLLYGNFFKIYVFDIGFESSFKLIVRDKEGNIIEGTDDENKLEFHSFRIEKLSHGISFLRYLCPDNRKKFFEEKFSGLLDQFIISDVDGFMNGNPFAT